MRPLSYADKEISNENRSWEGSVGMHLGRKLKNAQALCSSAWAVYRSRGLKTMWGKVKYYGTVKLAMARYRGQYTVECGDGGGEKRPDPSLSPSPVLEHDPEVGLRRICFADPAYKNKAEQYRHHPQDELISLIIPPCDKEYLEKALGWATAQRYKHWEMIIVDDKTLDDMEAVVDRCDDPRIRFYKALHPGSYVANINEALPKARGTYFCYLRAARGLDSDLLPVLRGELAANPGLEAVYFSAATQSDPAVYFHRRSPLFSPGDR